MYVYMCVYVHFFEVIDICDMFCSNRQSLSMRAHSAPYGPGAMIGSSGVRRATSPGFPDQHAGGGGLSPILCPITLRLSLLGQRAAGCRCSRHKVPTISDVEFDEFIQRQAPDNQLLVIAVKNEL